MWDLHKEVPPIFMGMVERQGRCVKEYVKEAGSFPAGRDSRAGRFV